MKYLRLSANGKCLPHPSSSITKNSLELLEEIGKRTKRKATTHQEILRVEEEDGKEEVEETGEVAITPTAVAEVEANILTMTLIEEIENIKNGTTTKATEEEKEIIRGTTPRNMNMKKRKEIMMIRRELGALLEGIDPTEMTEITKETTTEETTALIEGSMLLKEGAGGTIALIEGEIEVKGITLLI